MQKIIISAAITPNEAITSEELVAMLRKLGATTVFFESSVETVPTDEVPDVRGAHETVWLFASSDDSEPFIVVSEAGERDGEELSDEDLDRIIEAGVCVELHASYPRAERNGTPFYATEDLFAEGLVGSYGFKVPDEGALEVYAEDTGDDSAECFWLKIVLPKS